MALADTDFDTLAHARTLREAGVENKQAEAARAIRAGLVTKADLDAFATKADLDAGLNGLRADIYRALWIQIWAIIAAMTAIIAAFKLFA